MSDLSYAQHFSAIREALAPFESIWNHEVLHLNWQLEQTYPREWVESLAALNDQEAYQLDTGRQLPELHPQINELLTHLKALTRFPEAVNEPVAVNKRSFVFIKEKKAHEITKILPVIRSLKEKYPKLKVIDIGGGIGNLARALAFETGADVTSIDGNSEFQDLGRSRLKRVRAPVGAGEVNFFHSMLTRGETKRELQELFESHHMGLGLHTCGDLALSHIELHLNSKQKYMLNFGCCYNKLNPETDVSISKHASLAPLPFNQYALSLATRGYAKLGLKDYQLKKRVKLFRYGLHFLLEGEFGERTPFPVGECNTKIYWGDFHHYAKEKMLEHGFENQLSDQAIDDFLKIPRIKTQIELMISCDLLRWQFGRPIEFYLLLDRALYLQEAGKQVILQEYFYESLSPRNIGIFCLS